MNYIDLLLVALLFLAGVSGYRRGLVAAVLSLIGTVGGALIGLQIGPVLSDLVTDRTAQVAISGGVLIIAIVSGQAAGLYLGALVRRAIRIGPVVTADRVGGMVGQVLGALALVWLIALPIASLPIPSLSAQIRSSAILQGVDQAMPGQAEKISGRLRALYSDSGFPQVLGPLVPAPNIPVELPSPAVTSDPEVVAAQDSVVKVYADAPSCTRSMTGSSWVVAPETIVTNAHVVAGATTVEVSDGARRLVAEVVEYDADIDLAVLRVPGLTATPLPVAGAPVSTGQDAAAVGYPLDLPLTIEPIRVRGEMALSGPNIYANKSVSRDVYALRGSVRPGNSGGPLLNTDGAVIGVIFGAAIDDPDVGFALTMQQALPTINAGLAQREAVSTGACAAR